MRLYGLRLLVALLTFGVGVAAASLLGFGRSNSRPCGKRVLTYEPVAVGTAAQEEAPPPHRSCSLASRRVISGGVLQGKAISKPQPVYPPAAKAARVGGTVAVAVVVGESGAVESAEATSGPELLRDAAVEAARAARFSPTLLAGQPVKVSGFITYNFVLQ
jgi:protein TonB